MNLDFSQLSLSDYPDGTSPKEVRSVMENPRHRLHTLDGYPLKYFYSVVCGYSNKKRVLLVVARIVEKEIGDKPEVVREILAVKVADEDELETLYCQNTA